jgi:ADP-dependent NAD(P)H-hydrate dehydratase / NAD(P)H-hydrate epimerase
MRIVDRDQMKEIDRITIEEYGICGEILMENAGFEFVNAILEDGALDGAAPVRPVAVLCGGGNNGGDGFVIARLLKRRGVPVRVFAFADEKKFSRDTQKNFERLAYFGIPVKQVLSKEALAAESGALLASSFFIDALLGIGFHGTPTGITAEAIGFVNRSGIPAFAVDLPSGIDADGARDPVITDGLPAIWAKGTYTMGALKFGLVEYPGKEHAGRVRVLDIGFPPGAVEKIDPAAFFIDRTTAGSLLPRRRVDSHKGTYGHLAVVGGDTGYYGAALMSARSASRSGCGLVSVLFPEGAAIVKPDEIISGSYPVGEGGIGAGVDVREYFSRYSAIVVGPGMGVSRPGRAIIGELLTLGKNLLVDADGLTNLAQDLSILKGAKGNVVLTPHVGEMSRLCGRSKEEVKAQARTCAREFAATHGVTVVLKDSVTVIASGDGKLFINDGGIPALAKGGSGDVLSGIIGSLMARGLAGIDAAVLGVYLHTECGRIASERFHQESVTSADLIDLLPAAFSGMEKDGR